MSEYRITDLSAITQLAKADVVEVTDVSASTSAKITFQNLVAQAYADIKLVAATAAQTLSNTFAKLTVFDSSTIAYNCTVAGDKDSITVVDAGIYMVMFSCNFSVDTAKTIFLALSVGGTEDEDSQTVQAVPTTGALNVYGGSFFVLKSLAAGAVLTVEAKAQSGTPAVTFNNIDLVIKKIDASA
tara:strand:- start:1344 stop:1898 length:555 start_codon:yes stop_codon:yes gene_type:complete